jgi:outer membrane biosynthesis protein TonB
MRKVVLGFSAAVLALSLGACGGAKQSEDNVVTEEMNAMTNLEELAPVAPAENVAAEETVTEASPPEPAATKPAPTKPAPAKPMPATAEPKPEPAAEPKAPDPACLPEHRAAGHC